MKQTIFVVALTLLLASAGAAQPSGGRASRANPEERQKMMEQNRAKRNTELREALSLSPAVASKVDSVNSKYDLQLQELMKPENRGGGERGAMRAQAENIRKAREVEVKNLLTEEQQAKYNKWLASQQEQQQQQRRNRGAR
ncbi:MAG: hypothetical protein LBJ57_02260 [Prevotellaceae bacterium]|nr:hypothetical protein [Prevotellaceae bacterium]